MPEDFTPVPLPLMGEGVHEATVVRWFRKVGEKVNKDEPLIEVSTDKVDTEIPAPESGYLSHISIQEGQAAQVDQVMAFIGKDPDQRPPESLLLQSLASEQGGNLSESPGKKQKAGRVREPEAEMRPQMVFSPSTPGTYAGFVRSSPLVRKLARERGIDLSGVPGSGLYGRITRDDLEDYLKFGRTRYPAPAGNSLPEQEGLQTKRTGDQEWLDGVPVRRGKMSRIRQLTAEHMVRSVRTSPHVTTTFEINLFRVREGRKKRGEEYARKFPGKLTFTAFFLYAVSRTLKKHPDLNASVDGEDILYKDSINLGCAVAIDTGLIVPVIRDADQLSLGETAASLHDIAVRARGKKLSPQDVQGGTFSITNPGMFGSLHSQPIINQPQVAILSVGAIVDRPVAYQGEILVHPLCQTGLTFDHRLVDGEGGAKFLRDLKEMLEDFPEDFPL